MTAVAERGPVVGGPAGAPGDASRTDGTVQAVQTVRAIRADDTLVHAVRGVLARLRDPRRGDDGVLLAVPGLGSPPAVARFVRAEIEALAASPSPIDREAGQILRLYYLGRSTGHDVTAHRVHLSRATYFRRLDYGVRHLAEAVRALVFLEN